MPDAYVSTSTTNFDKTVVALIKTELQKKLRGGLAYTPKGSVIPAALVKGTNGVFRSVAYTDLPEDGAISIEDGQPDPDVEDLDIDYVEFTGAAKGRTVGLTDNAQMRSPHNLAAAAADAVARDIATSVDRIPRELYRAHGADLFAGTGNAALADIAAGDVMTAKLLKDAVALLRMDDVAPLTNGLYAFVADPLVINDLMQDDDFVNEIRHAAPESLLTGEVARYAGAAIIDAGSRGIVEGSSGTSSIDVHFGTLIGADAVFAALGGLHIIPVTGPDKADPLNRRDLWSWKGFLGGVLNDIQANRFLNIACATSL